MADDPFEAVITAIENLPTDTHQSPTTVLDERMRKLVQLRAMADATLTEQLAVFDARAAAQYDGQTSTRAWLRSQLRLGNDASQLLKVARVLPELPEAFKAFTAGEITLEHAAQLAWLLGKLDADQIGGYQQILLDLARQAEPKQLRIACEHIFQRLDPDQGDHDAAAQHRKRYLSASRTIDGLVHLQGLLDAAGGDVVLAALTAAMPVPAEYEERTADQRRADALQDIAAGWLAAKDAPTSGGLPAQVQVTVSLRALQSLLRRASTDHAGEFADVAAAFRPLFGIGGPFGDPAATGGTNPGNRGAGGSGNAAGAATGGSGTTCQSAAGEDVPVGQLLGDVPVGQLLGDVPALSDGRPISIGQARRLACDAGMIPVVLGTRSEPLDIGRHSRVVPTGLRRALNLRDGGCRFPGCDRPATWSDAHHIRHWADGGPTCLDNMVCLCAYHHTLVHQGWRLFGDPNGTIRFKRPDGTRLDLTSTPRCQSPARDHDPLLT